MRREQHTRLQRNYLAAAQPAELALLQYAQQFHLSQRTQFSDLVEEQRARARFLQVSFAPNRRSRKSAFFGSE